MDYLLVCIPTTRKGRDVTTLITLSRKLLSLFPGPCAQIEDNSVVRSIRPSRHHFNATIMDAKGTKKNYKQSCLQVRYILVELHRRFDAVLQAPRFPEWTRSTG